MTQVKVNEDREEHEDSSITDHGLNGESNKDLLQQSVEFGIFLHQVNKELKEEIELEKLNHSTTKGQLEEQVRINKILEQQLEDLRQKQASERRNAIKEASQVHSSSTKLIYGLESELRKLSKRCQMFSERAQEHEESNDKLQDMLNQLRMETCIPAKITPPQSKRSKAKSGENTVCVAMFETGESEEGSDYYNNEDSGVLNEVSQLKVCNENLKVRLRTYQAEKMRYKSQAESALELCNQLQDQLDEQKSLQKGLRETVNEYREMFAETENNIHLEKSDTSIPIINHCSIDVEMLKATSIDKLAMLGCKLTGIDLIPESGKRLLKSNLKNSNTNLKQSNSKSVTKPSKNECISKENVDDLGSRLNDLFGVFAAALAWVPTSKNCSAVDPSKSEAKECVCNSCYASRLLQVCRTIELSEPSSTTDHQKHQSFKTLLDKRLDPLDKFDKTRNRFRFNIAA